MIKKIIIVLACVLCFLFGWLGGIGYLNLKSKNFSQSSLILNKIKDVFKIVNVELEFSEIFQEKSYSLIDFGPFKKSIIVRVHAKILLGYNMDSSTIKIDSSKKIIYISLNQNPQIISNDMKLDYYDIQQGTFNQFTPEELNLIQDKARDIIIRKAETEEFLGRARTRQLEFIQTLQSYCDLIRWKLIVNNEALNPALLKK
ncbi:MAG: DUF4230 domain-containing protein [Saprospiraceae bacterium]|nr:DUF4230 domain-containing protein [Saprospiraceae bacterium]